MSLRARRSNPVIHPHPDPLPSRERETKGRCFVVAAPHDDKKRSQFDLDWSDEQLFPDVVYPDADFLFTRMNEATLDNVNPEPGEVILDIGCGRGIDGVELAKKGAVVIGLEPSPIMMEHARSHIAKNRVNMSLVQAVGEHLPFQAQSADKVVCKGALDHFPDPAEVVQQIAVVLKPEGEAIIAIANFESLGFKLGRAIWQLRKMLGFKASSGRMLWEVPEDHTYRFDYSSVKRLVNNSLEVKKISGVSLLFGLPWWGMFLAKCPQGISRAILNSLDKVACHLPRLGDVIVLRCKPK
jgi:SAM-dependent methyltransferase